MRDAAAPNPPLTPRRRARVAVGAAMALAQVAVAAALAPALRDGGDAVALGALWITSVPWSASAVLLLVRQADLPDIFTASMLVAIAAYAAFALVAALDARGTDDERNLVDTLFFGVTTGALTGMAVWGLAMGAARVLRLPATTPPG